MKADIVILIATFFGGVLCGALLYVSVFYDERVAEEEEQMEEVNIDGFIVQITAYGGCAIEGSCPTLQFDDTGAYTFVSDFDGEQAFTFTGYIARPLLEQASSTIWQAATTSSVITDASSCAFTQGGVDYTYTITASSSRFTRDTCADSSGTDPVISALDAVWAEVRVVTEERLRAFERDGQS